MANLTADLDTRCGELYPPGGELLPDREVGSDAAAVSASSLPPGDRAAVPGLVSSREPFEVLVCFLDGTDAAGLSHSELEERLDRDGRELLYRLPDDHLALRAIREQRVEQVIGDEGVARGRVESGHARALESVFGTVSVEPLAYRAPGLGNLHPADAVLNLPVERHSHGLRKLAALEAARGSSQDAVEAIERSCGQRLGHRQVQELAATAAMNFEDFYATRRPKRGQPQQLLVLSADGKGIVMRPDALRAGTATKAARSGPKTRLSRDQTRAHKRMAEIGAVYDATPVPRAAADILHRERDEGDQRTAGPVASNKWLTASVVKAPAAVIKRIFEEAQRRDPKHRRTWIALVDGANHQIQRIKSEAKARGVHVTIILDFVHVLEYLWGAAACFYPEGDPAAEQWVQRQATRVLQGHARNEVDRV